MGTTTAVAGIALLIASILLLTFFVRQSEVADRAANWFFLAFYGLMAVGAGGVHGFYAGTTAWMWIPTIGVIGVLAVQFAATVLVLSGRTTFEKVALVSTLGFVVLMLWMLAVSILVLTQGGLPRGLGWLGVVTMSIGAIVIGAVTTDRELVTGAKMPGKALMALFVPILLGMTTWIVWLGVAPTTPL